MRSNISIGGSGNCALPRAEKFPAAAGEQVFIGEARTPVVHKRDVSARRFCWQYFHAGIRITGR